MALWRIAKATDFVLWPSDIAEKSAREVAEFWQANDIFQREQEEWLQEQKRQSKHGHKKAGPRVIHRT